jgi:hypothetical protein
MLVLSNLQHGQRYVPSPNLEQQLADIEKILDVLRVVPVGTSLKKEMLNEAIWQVADAAGNTDHVTKGGSLGPASGPSESAKSSPLRTCTEDPSNETQNDVLEM